MIQAQGLVKLFQTALNEKWGYIWGASGEIWTESRQAAATREMTVRYGSRWIGRRVADCSGLFYWAFKTLGGSIYHGSNTIWNRYCARQGKLEGGKRDDGAALLAGTAVFKYRASDQNRYHIGLYVGNNTVIEAQGTRTGVVTSAVNRWHEWGELKGVAYEGRAGESMTLRSGDRGDEVKALQEQLNRLGYPAGEADGIFGPKTERAVKGLQAASGLTADGVVGPDTRQAIARAETRAAEKSPPASGGEAIQQIQSALAALAAGTSALQAALQALKRGQGDGRA